MTPLVALMVLASAIALVTGGFLFGARKGRAARAELLAAHRAHEATIESLRADLAARPTTDLREELDRALRPLVDRDRVGDALAEIAPGRSLADLPRVLDAICARGKLAAVVLGDEVGLPLGASSSATDVEVLAGVSSLVLTLADRSSEAGARPLAVLVHDDANRRILHRIFSVGDARFVLTAVARGRDLGTDALEPAVDKLEALLGRRAA